ncbi:MAG: HIT family protein [Anaerostipes sp.]|jgi:histidine triad (HIT) family protein|nr:HIT family protein [Anaerostipes sp.]MDD3745915.1 HIT family protein [Anaerostipes sp.]
MSKDNCVFCKIIDGDIPSTTIFENPDFKVILDVAPATLGHVLILPKEHFADVFDIDAQTAGKLFQLATVVARAMKQALHCDGMNILQNNGTIAGQTVFHFHMHLIPRYEGDGLHLAWKEQESKPEMLEEIRDRIRKAL